MKVISKDQVTSVLRYKELIPAMERALCLFSKKEGNDVVQPIRSVTGVSDEAKSGLLITMPAYCASESALAVKLVTFYKENKEVPTHNALVVVFNPENGVPQAIMDGDVITAMRTAAVSAVATKYLAKENPKILAILGSGVQARSHYHALTSLFTFDQVKIWSRTEASAKQLAGEVGAEFYSTVEEAVMNADVIVTVTSSPTPVLKAEWVKSGAHINAVGACVPKEQELDPDLVNKAVLYVDSYESAMKESGDIILSKAEIYAELGETILGLKEAYRSKTTVFKSLGLAVEDVISAKLVCDQLNLKDGLFRSKI